MFCIRQKSGWQLHIHTKLLTNATVPSYFPLSHLLPLVNPDHSSLVLSDCSFQTTGLLSASKKKKTAVIDKVVSLVASFPLVNYLLVLRVTL